MNQKYSVIWIKSIVALSFTATIGSLTIIIWRVWVLSAFAALSGITRILGLSPHPDPRTRGTPSTSLPREGGVGTVDRVLSRILFWLPGQWLSHLCWLWLSSGYFWLLISDTSEIVNLWVSRGPPCNNLQDSGLP